MKEKGSRLVSEEAAGAGSGDQPVSESVAGLYNRKRVRSTKKSGAGAALHPSFLCGLGWLTFSKFSEHLFRNGLQRIEDALPRRSHSFNDRLTLSL